MSLAIMLNGKLLRFPGLLPHATLEELIRELTLTSDRVAVELNGDIVARARWSETRLADNDRIEVVHFVGGGISSDSDG